MYDRTRALIEGEKSKFIFTGKHTKDAYSKLYHFAFVLLLASLTFGIWLLVLYAAKKPVYHGDVYLRDGPNPINDDIIRKIKDKFNDEIDGDSEQIELVIDTGHRNFIIATKDRIYFQINPDAKVFSGHNLINRDFAVTEISSLTVKSHMTEYLSIKVNEKYLGALFGGGFPRLEKLVQTLATDVTT